MTDRQRPHVLCRAGADGHILHEVEIDVQHTLYPVTLACPSGQTIGAGLVHIAYEDLLFGDEWPRYLVWNLTLAALLGRAADRGRLQR